MSRLEPYTQYAYYIKTYTIASEPYGGQTNIQYLTTDPDKPDPVRRLTALSNGSSEIVSVQFEFRNCKKKFLRLHYRTISNASFVYFTANRMGQTKKSQREDNQIHYQGIHYQ